MVSPEAPGRATQPCNMVGREVVIACDAGTVRERLEA
jgi:hypothetical protein